MLRPSLPPPVAEKRPEVTRLHDHERVDDYAWLRARDWQEVMRDPAALPADIRAYLEAENAYCAAGLSGTEALQEELFREMRARIQEDDTSVPRPDGAYAYAIRTVEGGQHPLYVRTMREGGGEETLLDGNAIAAAYAYFQFGEVVHSDDHARLAWSADTAGGESYDLRVRNLASGADGDLITETTGACVWSDDGRHLFYVRLDAHHRPSRVFRHALGADPASDVLVYEEPDPGFFVAIDRTSSRRFVTVVSHDHQTSEVRLIPADAPDAEPALVRPRRVGVEYGVDEADGTLFILTNADGADGSEAEDFRIVAAAAPPGDPAAWRDVVPPAEGRLILSHAVTARHLVRLERCDGLPRIVVRRLSDGAEHVVAFDEEAYSLGLSGGYEFDTDILRFTYSSMTTPARTYDYDMESRERVLRKEQAVPSGHDPARYVTRRLFAPAPDGEAVPVSVLHRADLALDGTAPCLLYGYGAYGITIPASFSTARLSLVDRGFVYAIAHIRGGKDKGYRWYRQGRRGLKTNSFADFIAAAGHLVEAGYTRASGIVAEGGSAGGLLVGAVANRAPPGLFGGILAVVPFVDVLNTMSDAALPLTPPEWPEWGNPLASAEDYRTILSYSPYDNVADRPYPPMLVMAGVTDPRVTYWEPAKWVARLRAAQAASVSRSGPLFLRTNMAAGHGGASGRFEHLRETALRAAFALAVAAGHGSDACPAKDVR